MRLIILAKRPTSSETTLRTCEVDATLSTDILPFEFRPSIMLITLPKNHQSQTFYKSAQDEKPECFTL